MKRKAISIEFYRECGRIGGLHTSAKKKRSSRANLIKAQKALKEKRRQLKLKLK